MSPLRTALAAACLALAAIPGAAHADGIVSNTNPGLELAPKSLDARLFKVVNATSASNKDDTKTLNVPCPAHYRVVSGGGELHGAYWDYANKLDLIATQPNESGTGWMVKAARIKMTPTLKFTLAYNDDDLVTGFSSWTRDDDQSYQDNWSVSARAICVMAE